MSNQKQDKTAQNCINKDQKFWDHAAQRYYYREANSFTSRQKGKRWPNYHKLPEKERDFWRACAQAYAQNYPSLSN
jgi:hypothetical protein